MAELFVLAPPTPVVAKPGEWATNHYCQRTVGEWRRMWEVREGQWERLFEAGALSFEPYDDRGLDPAEYAELEFVNSLVAVGLTPDQIRRVTEELPRPLAFTAAKMSYSFWSNAWEQPREPTADELYARTLEALDDECDAARLTALGQRCFDRLKALVDEANAELDGMDAAGPNA